MILLTNFYYCGFIAKLRQRRLSLTLNLSLLLFVILLAMPATAQQMTPKDARNYWFGYFDMITHDCQMIEKYGLGLSNSRYEASWIYHYRETNIIFVIQRMLGGPAAVRKGIINGSITRDTITSFINSKRDAIVEALEAKPAYQFPSEKLIPRDLEASLDAVNETELLASDEVNNERIVEDALHLDSCEVDTDAVTENFHPVLCANQTQLLFNYVDVEVSFPAKDAIILPSICEISKSFASVPPKWKYGTQAFCGSYESSFHHLIRKTLSHYRPVFPFVIATTSRLLFDRLKRDRAPGWLFSKDGRKFDLSSVYHPVLITMQLELLSLGKRTVAVIRSKEKITRATMKADAVFFLKSADIGADLERIKAMIG